MLNNFRKF